MKTAWRWALWMPLLLGSAWLVFGEDRSPPPATALSLPVRTARNPVAFVENATPAIPLQPRSQLFPDAAPAEGAARPDPFSARSWKSALPPASAPAAAPVAPPLPYTFIGKKKEAAQWEVFLARGDQTFLAREGQTLENTYRVDKVQPPMLTVTYLPLGQSQTLGIGEAE